MSSPSSSAPLQLHVTPRMQAAFQRCKQQIDVDQRKEEYRQLQQVFAQPNLTAAEPALITVAQLQSLSRLYRSTLSAEPLSGADAASAATAAADPTSDNPGNGWMHELMVGSRPHVPAPRVKQRDPTFLRFLEEQRWKQERREYQQLVKDLPGSAAAEVTPDNSNSVAGASRDIGHGLNIITLMVTGFVVFYYAGSGLFPHNKVMPVMFGLLGLIGAMLVEVSLFVVREQKSVVEREQQAKMKRAATKETREWESKQAHSGRTVAELERRRIAFEAHQAEARRASNKEAAVEENKID